MSSNAKSRMLSRAAQDIAPNMIVNLGIGLPTGLLQFLPQDFPVCLHSENGIAGIGPQVAYDDADRNLIDAGGAYISPIKGASYFDSATSFAIVRSGRLDLTVLGAFQVAANGDLANWMIPGSFTPGAGGAIELAQKAKRVIVTTMHTDKNGKPKIVENCNLPLTAKNCVNRIYTDMAVLDVTDNGLLLVEIAEGNSLQDVINATAAPLILPQAEPPTF
ncbi:MAG: acyl CoA:acetate/3-ketoacid CoA transferase subunit beta [Hyphomicrobiales bacterium]|nr:MAG: acyl CoA:acetate/3-ketoacid CoA transferase subunit beta [Hyphomicrobiales bacterium]